MFSRWQYGSYVSQHVLLSFGLAGACAGCSLLGSWTMLNLLAGFLVTASKLSHFQRFLPVCKLRVFACPQDETDAVSWDKQIPACLCRAPHGMRLKLLDDVFDSLEEKASMAPTCVKQSRPASSCRRPTSSGRYSDVTQMARSGPTWKTRRRLEAKRDEIRKPNTFANRMPASEKTVARASVKVLARPAASNRVPPLKGLQATGAAAQHPALSAAKGQGCRNLEDFRERRSRSNTSEELSSDPRPEVTWLSLG